MQVSAAASRFVKDGLTVAFAGSGGRLSIAFAYELVRQKRRRLRFASAGTGAPCLDLLVGAKAATEAEISFTMVSCYNIRRAVEFPKETNHPRGYKFEIEDYSNLAMSLRFFAAATGIPFIPIRSLIGSDMDRVRTFLGKEKMAPMKSPFRDGSQVLVLPPCEPDVAIMHAQFADDEGNVLAYGPAGSDGWTMKAAKRRIVTAEKIVPRRFVEENRDHVFLPGFMVDAVCEVPYGAHPYGLVDCYDLDAEFQQVYSDMSKTQKGFDGWAEEWIYGIEDRAEYLRKLGRDRLRQITTGRLMVNGPG